MTGEKIFLDTNILVQALDGAEMINQISFWDSLIVVAAESAQCNLLLSEDLNPKQTIRGVTVRNPYQG